jgi:hypothetical protein
MTLLAVLLNNFYTTVIFPDIQNGVIFGSIGGALLLILSQSKHSIFRCIVLFLISFLLGVFLAELFTLLIRHFFSDQLKEKIPFGFGALIASAISVKLLLWLINKVDDPIEFIQSIWRKKK